MSKEEIYTLIVSGNNKFGNLKRECNFKKAFPQIYEEFLNTHFIPEIENKTFRVKLWHFLTNVNYIPVCKVCGNPVKFNNSGYFRYDTYCSNNCSNKDIDVKEKKKNTCIKNYGCENPNQNVDIRNKSIQTCILKYGYDNYSKTKECRDRVRKSFIEHYGKENYSQTSEWKEKTEQTNEKKFGKKYYSQTKEYKSVAKNTCLNKYGSEYYFQTDEFKESMKEKIDEINAKIYSTKKKNKTFNTSKVENEFKEYLISKDICFKYQYKSEKYPFVCDFYLLDYDLYIEIQGNWTHGGHPFNPDCYEDILKLEYWKSKGSKYYDIAINVWSQSDVIKRKIAKDGELNWIEVFSCNVDDVIKEFLNIISNKE